MSPSRIARLLSIAILAALASAFPAAAQSPATRPSAPPATAPAAAANTHDGSLPAELRAAADIGRKMESARITAELGNWETADTIALGTPADSAKWTARSAGLNAGPDCIRLTKTKTDVASLAGYSGKKWVLPAGISYEVMIPDGPITDVGAALVPPTAVGRIRGGPVIINNGMAINNVAINGNISLQPNGLPYSAFALILGGGHNTQNNLTYLNQIHENVGGPSLKAGTWCKVTFLIGSTSIIATIDGQPVINEPLPAHAAQQMELDLYSTNDAALFRNIQILRPKTSGTASAAPVVTPSDVTSDQIKSAAQTAGHYLGDSNFETRQAASDALYMLRPASQEVLAQLSKETDPELLGRANQLAARIAGRSTGATSTTINRYPRGVMPMNQAFQGNMQVDIAPQ